MLMIAGCAHQPTSARTARTTPIETPVPASLSHTTPSTQTSELYTLEEALADVLSGPLTYVGTGDWFGLFRINACAYRNERVIVINIYCTPKEMNSFGLVVLSPTRGRAYIYAEADKPISTLKRADYLTFTGEVQLLPVDEKLAELRLTISYTELRAWDEQRYRHFLSNCFAGIELRHPQASNCSGALESHTTEWSEHNHPFLDAPPPEWFRIIKELRSRATHDGKAVSHPGG